jgi:hypothetical protein
MCWVNIYSPLGFSVDPTFDDATAWEYERSRAVLIYNGKLKVAIKRRCGD